MVGTTLSTCALGGFGALIIGADCGRSVGVALCSDEVRPHLALAAVILSAIFVAIGLVAAGIAFTTALVRSRGDGRRRLSASEVGLGLTVAVLVLLTLGVFIGTGERPRLPYVFFATGVWILAVAGLLGTGITVAIRRARQPLRQERITR